MKTARRSAGRAYLLLSRVSNLPTVWSNVLAGIVVSGAAVRWPEVLWLGTAASMLYTGGMFLNDLFDRDFDARERADRPVPAGEVSVAAVAAAGFGLLTAGSALAVAAGGSASLPWVLALAAAIVYYDYHHKRNPVAPLVMGLCRGLVYCVAAVSVSGAVAPGVLLAAAVVMAYVVGLTWIAKRLGPQAGIVVPLLVAGISLCDAAIIAAAGGPMSLVGAAAIGFPLTLFLQRYVPGT